MISLAAFRSLRYYDFRLIWIAQFVSTLGTQIQTVALAWLVYVITGSPAALGGIGLARAVPTILLSLFGGTLADQLNRRRLLLVTQCALAVLSALLAVAVSLGLTSIPLFYGFAVITAAAEAFDSPTSQAIIPQLVPREVLSNALTINVIGSDVAAVLGPTVGGLVLGYVGTSAAFWLDAASFLVVVGALLAMRSRPVTPRLRRGGVAALLDGLHFVRRRGMLWQLMVIDFLATLFVSQSGLLPVFARDVLKVGAQGLGLLYAAPSAGAVIGAAIFAFAPTPQRPGRAVTLAIAGYGLVLVLFGLSPTFLMALLFLAVSGGLDAVSMAMRHTVRQLATPNELRGRVGALAGVFSGGGPRLGEFQSGLAASLVGARDAMVFGGMACVAMVLTSRWWGRDLWSYQGEEEPNVAGAPEAKETVRIGD
ncbi:MAG TPA: MFS transporter [Thermomicrobiaceae bacterium]|nr:MFS transporter [Thermomicrobiaceae bacterium]